MPYHPVFNVQRFAEIASQNGFFLGIEATDPKFDAARHAPFLQGLGRGKSMKSNLASRLEPTARASGSRSVALRLIVVAAGCRQDMHNQPRYQPLRGEHVLRRRLERAAAGRGHGRARHAAGRRAFFTGKGERAVKELPFPVTRDVLDRGQERFNIYCTPCHDPTGDGDGMVVQRGYRQPPSFHDDRLRMPTPATSST